jgi:hypothetical protein
LKLIKHFFLLRFFFIKNRQKKLEKGDEKKNQFMVIFNVGSEKKSDEAVGVA